MYLLSKCLKETGLTETQGWRATRERPGKQAATTRHTPEGATSHDERCAVPSLGALRERHEQPLARIAPEPQQHENEHCGGEVAKPECQTWDVRERHAHKHHDSDDERNIQMSSIRRVHPIGTLTVRLNCSNSEIRSMISISHVPPGLNTAEFRT